MYISKSYVSYDGLVDLSVSVVIRNHLDKWENFMKIKWNE